MFTWIRVVGAFIYFQIILDAACRTWPHATRRSINWGTNLFLAFQEIRIRTMLRNKNFCMSKFIYHAFKLFVGLLFAKLNVLLRKKVFRKSKWLIAYIWAAEIFALILNNLVGVDFFFFREHLSGRNEVVPKIPREWIRSCDFSWLIHIFILYLVFLNRNTYDSE